MRAVKSIWLCQYLPLVFLCLFSPPLWAQTSWKGTVSTAWNDPGNWTAGVPDTAIDAILGNANFTGIYQPAITISAACKTLIVGGTKTTTLTVNRNLAVSGNVTINSNSTIQQGSSSLTLGGNWNNAGTYAANNDNSAVLFNGLTQSLGGTNVTTFRKLVINTNSTLTLGNNVTIAGSNSGLILNGTIQPGESPTYTISGTNLTAGENSVLKVNATTYAGNYNFSGTTLLNAGSTVDYCATVNNQSISNALTYATLRISGAGTKTLSGNLPTLNSSIVNTGNIEVYAGTLDMSLYSADRGTTIAGGTLRVTNGATLKIGGNGTFPANYTTVVLGLTTTVEYAGTNQTVAPCTYGHLTLSSSSGAAIKTFPSTAFTVTGNLTSDKGAGTSVSYTAGSPINIGGNLNIGTATTFDGSSYTHNIAGNWINNGTFTGSTSTINLAGYNTSVSGVGIYNINNLNIAAPVTANTTSINLSGNLSTTGAGTFTHLPSGTLTLTGTTKTINGNNINLDKLTISGTIAATATITLTDNLTVSGSYSQSSGSITMSGASKSISGTGSIGFSTLTISGSVSTAVSFSISNVLNVIGTFSSTANTASFTGTSRLNGIANLYNVTINGTSLSLAANAVLGISNVFAITAGTLNVTATTPNTVLFNGTGAQTVNAITYHHLQLINGSTKTAAGNITVNESFTLGASTTFNAGPYTQSIGRDLINNGTFTAGTSTVQLTGIMDASITGATTFNTLTINKTAGNVIALANDVNVGTLNMTSGNMNTGSNMINITTTRNGNGIILGTIKRTHAFVALTSYAFEGPDNTVNITGVNTISAITMTVTKDPVGDIPYGGSVNRQYNISVTGSFGISLATLRLHYEDGELNGSSESGIQLWRNTGSSWAVSGKTTNSTTSNYVEQTLLLSIAGRWTFSENQNVTRWNGSAGTAWNTAANWTAVQGSPGSIPGATDVVQIGTAAFTNQPTITTGVTVKNIVFGSVQNATLSIGSGGSLTTNGNINGSWSANATHTINAGNQALSINGDLALSDGTAGHAINLNIGTGTVSIAGSLTQSGNASLIFSGAGALNIGGKYAYTNGTFTANGSTVTYNGSSDQSVAGLTYNHLTINKASGIATAHAATTIAGNLNVTSGTLDLNIPVSIGNVTTGSGTVLEADGVTMTTAGNWNNNGMFLPGSGTVTFNGSSGQTITATVFNHLTINKTGTATLSGNLGINGNLTVQSGTLDLATYTADRTSTGGNCTLANGTGLSISGNSFPANYTTYTLGSTSTTEYKGAAAQNIGAVNYGNLILINGGSNLKTLSGSTSIAGDLTISNGASLDGSSQTLILQGNFNNSGSFIPSTSTCILTGGTSPGNKLINGTTSFYHVVIPGYYTISAGSNLTINGNILVTGALNTGTNQKYYYGNVEATGTITDDGTATFMGTQPQQFRLAGNYSSPAQTGTVVFAGTNTPAIYTPATLTFNNYQVNNTQGFNNNNHLNITGTFTVANGSKWINTGNTTVTLNSSLVNDGTITAGGNLVFTPANTTTLQMGTGSQFQSTGTVIFGGAGQITLNGTPDSLNNVNIINTNNAGLSPASGWTVRYLTIGSNSTFNAGSYSYLIKGHLESDGKLNGSASSFTMSNASGFVSASKKSVFQHVTISGNITPNTDLNLTGNFINNGTYTGTNGALIMTGNTAAGISGSTSPTTLAQLTIDKSGSTVTMATGISSSTDLNLFSGTLNTGSYVITQDLSGGKLTITANAILKIGGNNSLPAFNSYNLDTLSTVDYAGTTQTISGTVPYGNLTISAAGTKTAAAALHILNNFTLTDGTFVPGNFTDTLDGNWTMTGGAMTNTGSTILLRGIGNQNILSTGAFNNLSINKLSGTTILAANTNVNGTLQFIKGILQTGNFTSILSSGASVIGASQSTGWVNGRLQKYIANGSNISRTYEIGDNSNYTPVTTLFTSVTNAGNLAATTKTPDHPSIAISGIDNSKSVNRYWSFTNSNMTFTSASVTANWVVADVDGGASTSSFRLANYNGIAWSWPAVTATQPTSIQATGMTTLGDIAIGNIISSTTWTGSVSTDWFTPGNWSAGFVPGNLFNVIIPASRPRYPVINTDIASVKDLTIQSGAAVTVSNAGMGIAGNITNSGAFTADQGTILMNGTAAQNIPTAAFTNNTVKNLTVNNAAGVSLTDSLKLTGTLLAANGSLNTAGYLTLISTAAATALIDGSGNGDVLGRVTMQRYLASGKGYKYISSPFRSATVSEFSNDIPLGAAFPPLYRYDENLTSSGWVKYTTLSDTLRPLHGYAVNTDAVDTPKTIDLGGVVNNGVINSATLYNHNRTYTKGFHLVGNPYPSPIDWNAVSGWSRSNIDNAVYYFNAGHTDRYTGTYSSYVNGISSDGIASNVIPAMQGFFIHVSDGSYPVSGSYSINNNARVNNLSPHFHKATDTLTAPLIRLAAGFSDQATISDPAVIYFDETATKDFDQALDALKLMNTDSLTPNIYTVTPGLSRLSISAWPGLQDTTTIIPLGLNTIKAGWITLKVADMERVPDNTPVYLHDALSDSSIALRSGINYRIYLNAGDHEKRFSLRLSKNGYINQQIPEAYSKDGDIYININDTQSASYMVSVINLLGQVILQQPISGQGEHKLEMNISSGIYIVSVYNAAHLLSKKVFVGN